MKIIDDIKSKYFDFGFNAELVKAELTNFGNSLVLNIPAFKTEEIEDCRKIISKTYNSKNLFFTLNLGKRAKYLYIKS